MSLDAEVQEARRDAYRVRSAPFIGRLTRLQLRAGQGLFMFGSDSLAHDNGSVRVVRRYTDPVPPNKPYDSGHCTNRLIALLDLQHYIDLCLEQRGVAWTQILKLEEMATLDPVYRRWTLLPGLGPDEHSYDRKPYRGGLVRLDILMPGEVCPHCTGEKKVRDVSIVQIGGGSGCHPWRKCPTCVGKGVIEAHD